MSDTRKPKQTYEAPQLTRHGSVRTKTLGPSGGAIDQLFGGDGGFQGS